VNEVIAEWGPPLAIYEADQRFPRKRYLWVRNEGVVEHEGTQLPGSCATRFVVDEGRIVSFFYDGNSCKAADHWSYPGIPTFSIVGSSRRQDPTTTQWFSVVEFFGIHDLPLQPGCDRIPKGAGVPASCIGTELPARPMKLRLRGMHMANITAEEANLRRANGTFLSVEGEVEFTPIAGHQYVVTGTLTTGRSAVWVEDQTTKQPATAMVHE